MSRGVFIHGSNNKVAADAENVALINTNDYDVTSTDSGKTILNNGDFVVDADGLTKAAVKRRRATLTGTGNTIAFNDGITLFFVDASAGNVTITLEHSDVDRLFIRIDSSGNSATITPSSGLIDGGASYSLAVGSSVIVVSDLTNQHIIPATTSSGGVSDGDKGDIVVSVGGTVWTIDSAYTAAVLASAESYTDGEISALAAAKQDSLVSGTNIKTVNGNSLLGAGNLVIGGAVAITQFEQNVSATPTWRGKFTVADAGISGSSKIQIWQAFAALTGKGARADENEMDSLIVNAEAGSGQMTVYWETTPQYITSTKLRGGNSSKRPDGIIAPYQDAFIFEQKRIGKVKGNFKFNYIIG